MKSVNYNNHHQVIADFKALELLETLNVKPKTISSEASRINLLERSTTTEHPSKVSRVGPSGPKRERL